MKASELAAGNPLRAMRHSECQLSPDDAEKYLREESWGVLSVHGDSGFPYGVPMNYIWDQGTILLHATAENSHRLDALKRDSKVCFTVVPEHRLDRDRWTTEYASVIVFGTAEILREPEDKLAAMCAFMQTLSPHRLDEAFLACPPAAAKMVMIRIHPVMITGKRNT